MLGRVLINRQPNANLDAPPNFRYCGQSGHGAELISVSRPVADTREQAGRAWKAEAGVGDPGLRFQD